MLGVPEILKYQFSPEFTMKISDLCCDEIKKYPMKKYEKESGRKYKITGMRKAEGGRRTRTHCVVFRKGRISFQPLAVITDEWEEWFIKKHNIKLCKLYYPPYNFLRTGCKGCPYAIEIQAELETLSRLLPAERKQCEYIWKPVYEEYRRIGYRLKKNEQQKLF